MNEIERIENASFILEPAICGMSDKAISMMRELERLQASPVDAEIVAAPRDAAPRDTTNKGLP